MVTQKNFNNAENEAGMISKKYEWVDWVMVSLASITKEKVSISI